MLFCVYRFTKPSTRCLRAFNLGYGRCKLCGMMKELSYTMDWHHGVSEKFGSTCARKIDAAIMLTHATDETLADAIAAAQTALTK